MCQAYKSNIYIYLLPQEPRTHTQLPSSAISWGLYEQCGRRVVVDVVLRVDNFTVAVAVEGLIFCGRISC